MRQLGQTARRRVAWTGVTAGFLIAAALHAPTYGGGRDSQSHDVGAIADGHAHDHNDPATMNAISRGELGAGTEDPTTPGQARANEEYAAAGRAAADPELTTVPLRSPRRLVPESRYAMAGGCYALRTGSRIRFQATHLGRYLLYTTSRTVLTGNEDGSVTRSAAPGPDAVWTARKVTGGFTLRLADGRYLRHTTTGLRVGGSYIFALRRTTGCPAYPEISVGVSGLPHAGATPYQEVRGYADAHTHGMTHEFLGGRIICSPPWHPYGVASALKDCPDHEVAGGRGAVLEDFTAGRPPGSGHDAVGWPTFGYWPNHYSLTHQQLYYKWLERSWRGGLRLFTSLLTENNVLCEIYPLKKNSCDDMDAVRLQAKRMRQLENYVDAQYGGPGKGWYRIVTTPWQARKVINQGKLAVIMGMETSVPFGCHVKLRVPMCDESTIDAGVAEIRRLGVSQIEIVNKFDNALTGVAGDGGTIGPITNTANFYNTGSFLRMETCPAAYPAGVEDRLQEPTAPGGLPAQDAIFGAIGKLFGDSVQPAPVYPPGPHCNQMGLTTLGRHLLNRLIDKRILFDPDHMSVYGRKAALDLMEAAARDGRHPGVISSHSWGTPDAYPRIYRLGGFVTPYAGDSTGFLAKWRQHLKWADKRYYFGFGYGADMNGFGAQGGPRGAGVSNPVRYPFTGLNGVRLDKQRSGRRVYDINRDGVSHYGLYPDWIQDVKLLAGAQGPAFATDMARGAEAYLQTWERAHGIKPDPCRNPGLRLYAAKFRSVIRPGMTTIQVLGAVGQPYHRLGSSFHYCTKTTTSPRVGMKVEFGPGGLVRAVRRVG
jgi:hypothetical protein